MQKDIVLAGGCFWGTQKYLSLVHGVLETEAGYANGECDNPTYEQVCAGSGHAEAVRVGYDDAEITLPFLLQLYFESIDPTAVNHQGGDHGINYRTGIYYNDEADLPVIREAIAELTKKHDKPIAIEVEPLRNYFPAELYHQRYLDKTPGGYCHINFWKMRRAQTARDPAIQR